MNKSFGVGPKRMSKIANPQQILAEFFHNYWLWICRLLFILFSWIEKVNFLHTKLSVHLISANRRVYMCTKENRFDRIHLRKQHSHTQRRKHKQQQKYTLIRSRKHDFVNKNVEKFVEDSENMLRAVFLYEKQTNFQWLAICVWLNVNNQFFSSFPFLCLPFLSFCYWIYNTHMHRQREREETRAKNALQCIC